MTKLFVGNLPFSMNEQELQQTFSINGLTIQSVRIVLDRATQRPRGFAFVEVQDEQADAFIKEWNTRPLQGRPVHVEKPRKGFLPPVQLETQVHRDQLGVVFLEDQARRDLMVLFGQVPRSKGLFR